MTLVSAPYLRHVLGMYLKMALNVPRAYVDSTTKSIGISYYDDSTNFIKYSKAFIRNNIGNPATPINFGAIRNYFEAISK